MTLPGRARTPEQKRAIMERVLAAWLRLPEQRLCQLIVNACHRSDVFYVEDEPLAERVEGFSARAAPCKTKEPKAGDLCLMGCGSEVSEPMVCDACFKAETKDQQAVTSEGDLSPAAARSLAEGLASARRGEIAPLEPSWLPPVELGDFDDQ